MYQVASSKVHYFRTFLSFCHHIFSSFLHSVSDILYDKLVVVRQNILPPRDQHFVLFAPRASSLRHQEKKYVKTVRQAGTNRKKTSRAHSVKSVQQVGVPFLIKIKNKY